MQHVSTSDSRDVLSESLDAVTSFMREGTSKNTVSSYRGAVNYWVTWHRFRYNCELQLPLRNATVVDFITDHLQHATAQGLRHNLPAAVDLLLVQSGAKRKLGPLKLATVRHRIAVISEAHDIKSLPNPCRSPTVHTLLARVRAAYAKRNVQVDRKDALTKEPFERMLDTCDESLIGIRDKALLLFAWASGGRRRSEVVGATIENTRRVSEGFIYMLRQSKTNQHGQDRSDDAKPIVGRAALALEAWLNASGINQGAIFRRVRRGGKLGDPLAPEAVRKIVQTRAKLANLDGNFSAHSLRSGFVTEAGIQGRPIGEIMAMTGHTSVASVAAYHRVGSALTSRTGRLLETDDLV